MNLTQRQHTLIQRLILKGGSARTDELASSGISNSQVSESLLPLRATGGLTSLNDGGQYVLWTITDGLRNAIEAARVAALPAPAKPFRVLRVSNTGITLFDTKFTTEGSAANFAKTNIQHAEPDVVNYVVTLHKSMSFVKPVAAGVVVNDL